MELLVQLLRQATNGLARTGNIIIVHGEGINIQEAVREHIGLLGCINGQVEELLSLLFSLVVWKHTGDIRWMEDSLATMPKELQRVVQEVW